MEKLSLNKFSDKKLENMKVVQGGTEIKTKMNGLCDIWYDDDEDGTISEGDCIDFVDCE
jgi:hypothetical protein